MFSLADKELIFNCLRPRQKMASNEDYDKYKEVTDVMYAVETDTALTHDQMAYLHDALETEYAKQKLPSLFRLLVIIEDKMEDKSK